MGLLDIEGLKKEKTRKCKGSFGPPWVWDHGVPRCPKPRGLNLGHLGWAGLGLAGLGWAGLG